MGIFISLARMGIVMVHLIIILIKLLDRIIIVNYHNVVGLNKINLIYQKIVIIHINIHKINIKFNNNNKIINKNHNKFMKIHNKFNMKIHNKIK